MPRTDRSEILCLAELRGGLARINELAKEHGAVAVIHTGTFGFYDADSPSRMTPNELRAIAAHSPNEAHKSLPADEELPEYLKEHPLSDLPRFISGELTLNVPVYTIWGSNEDPQVVDQFVSQNRRVPNLYVLGDSSSFVIPNTALRVFGLGGAFCADKLFDAGDKNLAVAGTGSATWASAWGIGKLVQAVSSGFRANTVNIFLTHSSPRQNPILEQLAVSLRADFVVSSGTHSRYSALYSAYTTEASRMNYQSRLSAARSQFEGVWQQVQAQVTEALIGQEKNSPLSRSLSACVAALKTSTGPKPSHQAALYAFRNLWHLNLCDVECGYALMHYNRGKLAIDLSSQGLDFGKRMGGVRRRKDTPGQVSAHKQVERYGLWFKDGSKSNDEIIALLDERDRPLVKSVVRTNQPNKPSAVHVLFASAEKAAESYARVDKDKAGSVSILRNLRFEA